MKPIFTYSLKRLLPQILGWGLSLALYSAIVLSFFHIVLDNASEIQKLLGSLPKALTALAGDLSKINTIEGFMQFRIFMIFPMLLGMFAIISGSGLLAHDEERGCLDLFMGYPIKRSHMFIGRLLALLVALIIILSLIWGGIATGIILSSLEIGICATIPALCSLGAIIFLFMCCGLMFSMILASRMAAMMVTGLIMLITQMIFSLANISASLKPIAIISPFKYYQGVDAIKAFHWVDFSILLMVAIFFIIIAHQRFLKRDIRVAGEGEFQWKKFALVMITIVSIFIYTLVYLTKNTSFISPKNCFDTVNQAIEKKDWKILCKALTEEAKEKWTADALLRITFTMFDIGENGAIRMLQNPDIRPSQFNFDVSQDKAMTSLVKMQIAVAGINFSKLQKHIHIVASYPEKLYLTVDEIKKLASCVYDKDSFIQSTFNTISDFTIIKKYKSIQNIKIEKNHATAILATNGSKQKIFFKKNKQKWFIHLPIMNIAIQRNKEIGIKKTTDIGDYILHENIVYDAKYQLTLDAYVPKSKKIIPAVLLIHGGRWRAGDKSQLIRYANILASKKIACFSINYRLAPKYKFPAQIIDCRNALLWIRKHALKYNIDGKKIGAMGYSAGGHLAALMATTGKIEKTGTKIEDTTLKVVVVGGAPTNFAALSEKVTVFTELFGNRSKISYAKASPETYASKNTCAMGFFHGQQDTFVSLNGPLSPMHLHEKLKELNIETKFKIIPDIGHLETINNKNALQFTQDFLIKYLLIK